MAVAKVLSTSKILPQSRLRAVRSDHDRSRLVAGRDDLEHEVRTAFVDGQIAQLIEEEQRRVYISPEGFFQGSIDLGGGQYIDHVDHPGKPY